MIKKIGEDTAREVKRQLMRDSRFTNTLRSLGQQARKAGFTNDFKTRIISTALVRAKSLVPEVRKKIVSEALKREANRRPSSQNNEQRRSLNTNNKERRTSSSERKPANNKPVSDLDILRS
jgi:hypothetical protein